MMLLVADEQPVSFLVEGNTRALQATGSYNVEVGNDGKENGRHGVLYSDDEQSHKKHAAKLQ